LPLGILNHARLEDGNAMGENVCLVGVICSAVEPDESVDAVRGQFRSGCLSIIYRLIGAHEYLELNPFAGPAVRLDYRREPQSVDIRISLGRQRGRSKGTHLDGKVSMAAGVTTG
jgi:hypothetical protein